MYFTSTNLTDNCVKAPKTKVSWHPVFIYFKLILTAQFCGSLKTFVIYLCVFFLHSLVQLMNWTVCVCVSVFVFDTYFQQVSIVSITTTWPKASEGKEKLWEIVLIDNQTFSTNFLFA